MLAACWWKPWKVPFRPWSKRARAVHLPLCAPPRLEALEERFLPCGGTTDSPPYIPPSYEGYIPSTTMLTSSANPAGPGSPVTFTATVANAIPGLPYGTPTGLVTFSVDGTGQTPDRALDASGTATFTTSTLGTGTHTIVATYNGDYAFLPSSAMLTQVVNAPSPRLFSTITRLTSSANPAVAGSTVTFTATVANAIPGEDYGTPTGSVTFMVDGTAQSPDMALDASGKATFTTSTLGMGTHTIVATYNGDSIFRASTATLTQVVTDPNSRIIPLPIFNQGEKVTGSVPLAVVTGGAGFFFSPVQVQLPQAQPLGFEQAVPLAWNALQVDFNEDHAVWDNSSDSINDFVWRLDAPALKASLTAPHDFLADECQVELWSTQSSPKTPTVGARLLPGPAAPGAPREARHQDDEPELTGRDDNSEVSPE